MKVRIIFLLYLQILAFTMIFFIPNPIYSEIEKVDNNYINLTVEETYNLVFNGSTPFIIDVRTQSEWDEFGFIHGATRIQHDKNGETVMDDANQLPSETSQLIIVYCKTGIRASWAVSNLTNMGYSQVYNVEGGIEGWKNEGHFVDVTPELFQSIIKNERNNFLIDARSQEEWDTEHIDGATLIEYKTIEDHINILPSNKSDLLLVYCKTGYRGSIAAQKLEEIGYENIMNLAGGIDAWINANYDISIFTGSSSEDPVHNSPGFKVMTLFLSSLIVALVKKRE